MAKIRLGQTEIVVEQNGFGALPLQRIPEDEAVHLIRKAYENGMDFFDTARGYSNSEGRVGLALSDVRENVIIASKTMSSNADEMWDHLETSLSELKTTYIDIYQFHNPAFCPKPGGEDGLYDAALKAKEQGKIRHIGITNHRLNVAHEAIDSGLFETLQFPLSYLAGNHELELVKKCKEADMAFIAMKGLSGGLITEARAACAYIEQFDNVEAIWGVQRESELDEFLDCIINPPSMTKEIEALIEKDKNELSGEFCRGCGYCMPCPVDIEIFSAARTSLMMRRAPRQMTFSDIAIEKMHKVKDCIGCGACKAKCPYGLDPQALIKKNYEDFLEVLDGKQL